MTLAPTFARAVVQYSFLLCFLLDKIPWLRTHYLVVISKCKLWTICIRILTAETQSCCLSQSPQRAQRSWFWPGFLSGKNKANSSVRHWRTIFILQFESCGNGALQLRNNHFFSRELMISREAGWQCDLNSRPCPACPVGRALSYWGGMRSIFLRRESGRVTPSALFVSLRWDSNTNSLQLTQLSLSLLNNASSAPVSFPTNNTSKKKMTQWSWR